MSADAPLFSKNPSLEVNELLEDDLETNKKNISSNTYYTLDLMEHSSNYKCRRAFILYKSGLELNVLF